MSDYFSMDIGFSAPFNLISLNPTLDEIGTGIKSDANCGGLNKAYETMPGIGNVSSAKRPTPSYFVLFDVKASMPLMSEFRGSVATNTRESYRLLAAARVIDRNATVFQSFLAEEAVENEISFGRGIGKAQVREVALKNASVRLTQSFLQTIKFAPREYQVAAVAEGRVKLANAAKASVRNGSFFRPLNIRVAGSRVIVPFETSLVAVEAEPQVQPEGNDLWITVTDPRRTLREGDVFRTSDLTESKEDIRHCGKAVFQIPNNALKVASASAANLTVAHALAVT